MTRFKLIGSLAAVVMAGTLLSACWDEPAQSNKGTGTSSTAAASTTTTTAKKAAEPWYGTSDKAVTVAPVLTTSNFMIVYDGSGSMSYDACGGSTNNRHTEGLAAMKTFVNAIPDAANTGLYVFDANSRGIRVHIGAGNKSKVITSLDAIRVDNGTPLGEAVYKSYESLKAQAQKQLGYGRYSLVILTDGEASDASYLSKVIDHVSANSPVEIHTIGLCFKGRHTLNQQGKTFYAAAQSPKDIVAGLKSVLAEAENVTPDDFQ